MKKLLILLLFQSLIFRASAQITGIKISGDPCTTLTLPIQVSGTSSSPYFFWNFGDTASGVNDTITILGGATVPFPTHKFTKPGVYTVCATFQEPGAPITTICRTFIIGLCCNGIITSLDSCLGSNTSFSLISTAAISGIAWNFGDPASGVNNTSINTNPLHQFSDTGTFTVTATVTATCGTFVVTLRQRIINCAIPVCNGSILVQDSCRSTGTRFSISSTSTVSSIIWKFGDPASGANDTSTNLNPLHRFSNIGTFTVTAIVTAACGTYIDTLRQRIINCTQPVCTGTIQTQDSCRSTGTRFSISSTSTVSSVTWNFGDPASGANDTSTNLNPLHRFSNIGTFTVTARVNAACGTYTDTLRIRIINCTTPVCSGTIQALDSCRSAGSRFSVRSTATVNSVVWTVGDSLNFINTSTQLTPRHYFSDSGYYNVRAIVNLSCGVDTIFKRIRVARCGTAGNNCNMIVPTAFSPNDDNLNDFFAPKSVCTPDFYRLSIYNRYGEMIFSSNDLLKSWNGTYKGFRCEVGVYCYFLEYQFAPQLPKTQKGTIVLIR